MRAAKILALVYTGVFTVFALLSGAENTEGVQGILENLPNIIPFLLVWIAVSIAWRKPKVGGMLFLALAIVFMIFFHAYRGLIPFSIICLPLVVIGILFLAESK